MKNQTFMSRKYYSMLFGGTMTSVIVSLLMLSDSIIAGVMLGEDAVSAINLAMPIFSLTTFFSQIISLGTPILYSNAIGSFDKDEADHVFGLGVISAVVTGIL